MKIRSSQLTTRLVAPDATNVGLEFLDQSGAVVTVELPVDQAEAVVMTLPHLLARALVQRTGSDEARYVFNLDEWAVESVHGQDCLLATLKTGDGFEVCFGIPLAACQSLGRTLQQGADAAVDAGAAKPEPVISGRVRLN